jgi:sigma-E factor negative regulatory protein RseA
MTSKTESMTGEEALSALVDGELEALPRNRILGRLLEDEELRARWARYHAGRASLEGTDPGLIGAGFSERVAAAVSAEPPIVAPGQLRGARRPIPERARVAVAAAAIGAVVAVGGVLVLRDGAFGPSAPSVADNDRGTTVAAGGDAPPLVSGTFGDGLAPAEQDRVRQRLAMYLNSHNRFADAGEMPNVMPSSRLVGFNAEP